MPGESQLPVSADHYEINMQVVPSPADKPRQTPGWLDDPVMVEKVWRAYDMYLQGQRVTKIAETMGVTPKTVYTYLDRARSELPYLTVALTYDLVEQRRLWVTSAYVLAAKIAESNLRLDRKSEMFARLMTAAGPWMSAIEELVGVRKGAGRINIQQSGENAQAVLLDVEKLASMIEKNNELRNPPDDIFNNAIYDAEVTYGDSRAVSISFEEEEPDPDNG